MNDLLKFAEEIQEQCQNGASISDIVDALGKYILADRAASGEPVDAILVSDCVDRTSALFGDGLFSTRDNITQLYTRAQPTPAQIAEKEEARNWRRWQEAQDYVAKELPEGFRIVMNMAQDDWYISLYDSDDNSVDFDSGDNSSHAIANAVNVAISMNKGEPL